MTKIYTSQNLHISLQPFRASSQLHLTSHDPNKQIGPLLCKEIKGRIHTLPPWLLSWKRIFLVNVSHNNWFSSIYLVILALSATRVTFELSAEYIMRNAGLEETQAGIKIAPRNINNLRYAETPPLWQKVKRN